MTTARDAPEDLASPDGRRLSDIAYARILEILFERRLPAGAFVSQSELVTLTGVSVAPLRDALRVLEADGIVTIHPRSGIEFVKPGLELTRATYQFRGIVEAAAVAVYAETADEADMAAVERSHRSALEAIEREGLTPPLRDGLETLEDMLHNAIIASLRNPLIETSYRRIHNYLRILRLDRKITPPLALRSIREHLAIIEACRRRNAAEAQAALQTHFTNALQRHMGLY
ncbi:GntR family transcriptional regulator [Labrys wisconsinensis]|uniref:DNA-binding GntR family transcriptional regulator n=1 Tax=Labrys wisconsinensis TaxID=425677 RepID=A0ABU0JN32_9HYPH|nr:GntR family transcriptional regulator [Labrys wisconsinensis]MDQ0474704.1 DNA-binding GntR family transcriptional regulator [Labrys wisconsinensis]